MNNIQSTSATVGIMTQKVIEAAGCRFTEHRGEGMPVRGNPLANPGDIYFDVQERPYTVWVCQIDSGWNQWTSMAESSGCKHPEQDRILCPSVQHLAWVPISGYNGYLRQTNLRLGKQIDAADTHIEIVLDQERGLKPVPQRILEPSPVRPPSSNSSVDDGEDDGEDEQLAQPEGMTSSAVEDVPTKPMAEIMAEIRADFEDRCRTMRNQNDDIQKALTTSSGTW